MKISRENQRRYADKSIPEYVTLTVLGLNGDRIVGCEAKNGYSMCVQCPIGRNCFMRSYWAFNGGRL